MGTPIKHTMIHCAEVLKALRSAPQRGLQLQHTRSQTDVALPKTINKIYKTTANMLKTTLEICKGGDQQQDRKTSWILQNNYIKFSVRDIKEVLHHTHNNIIQDYIY